MCAKGIFAKKEAVHFRLFCLLIFLRASPFAMSAQVVFQKKIDSLHDASGLAVVADGGYLLGGVLDNCVQIVRFDAAGGVLWSKKIFPTATLEVVSIGALQVFPDAAGEAFFVLFRKGILGVAPEKFLNLLKFDAAGNFLWECQLHPYLNYGPSAFGNQMCAAPNGTVWAVQALGNTPDLPFFNQALVFKVSPSGELLLRNKYRTNDLSVANGVIVRSDGEIYIYGGLGYAIDDGFILKINENGDVLWAKKCNDFYLSRDGGRFQNGDFLLTGQHRGDVAFARIRPDGTVAWCKKLTGLVNSGFYGVASDDGIFAATKVGSASAPTAFLKIAPDASTVEWLNVYEKCTAFLTLEVRPTTDNGLIFSQDANIGRPHTRLIKVNETGEILSDCPVSGLPLPTVEDISIEVEDLNFIIEKGDLPAKKTLVTVAAAIVQTNNFCPSDLPEAIFSLPDSVCAGTPFQVAAEDGGNATEWSWKLPGGVPDAAQNAVLESVVFPASGNFIISLTQHYGVCADSISDTLRVIPPLEVELFDFADTLLCPSEPFVAAPIDTTFEAWLWSDGSTEASRFFQTPKTGFYRLTAFKNACAVSDSFSIKNENCGVANVFIPNVFSPNADGENARFQVFGSQHELLEMQIFDRWGGLLFEGKGNDARWDGRCKGKDAPTGVFAYRLRYLDLLTGEYVTKTGTLVLLR